MDVPQSTLWSRVLLRTQPFMQCIERAPIRFRPSTTSQTGMPTNAGHRGKRTSKDHGRS
jgi:hypothetical protein